MNNIRVLSGLCFLFFFSPLFSQNQLPLTGMVTNERDELLIGATVFWKGARTGTVTDTAGRFSLPARTRADTLIVRYIGSAPAKVEVLPTENNLWIVVTGITELQTVTVSEHVFGNTVSILDPHNVERISSKELRKAPCCNLSESFETNGTVDVAYTNALTGVKEIQMLGLRGIYSQFLLENRPTMGGIATPFAFEYLPGTWLNGIVLAKGASTVKNGNAGISGQINADLVKPNLDKPLFVNFFSSTEGRGELNVHLNKAGKNGFSNGLLLHGNLVENERDMNRDNFYDGPSRRQLNGLYRVQYDAPDVCAQFNVQALTDHRRGGQIREAAARPGQLFGIDQQNDRVEVWGKLGRENLFGKPYNQVGNMVSASWHRSQAVYGPNTYAAAQQSLYWQSLYETIFGTTDHKIVVAPSFQLDDIRERVNETDLNRREAVPGAMVEYTYSRPNLKMEMPDLVVVLGARTDWNSRFGWLFTPRLSAKYNFTEKSVARLSAGRGYRSPNLVAENISLLASNRQLRFAPDLGLEAAWNYGFNVSQRFEVAKREANFSIDLYRTDFTQQIVVDVEQDPTQVHFYNLQGRSFSNSLLVMLQYNLLPGLDMKLAYKWNDVRTTFADGQLRSQPLIARHRGLVTLDYATPNKRWNLNTYVQIVGPQRLPDNSQVPHELTHDFPTVSPTFATWNLQVTRRVGKKFELYLGGENLTNYRQHHAIIAADDPTSPFFNGSQIWAPTMGTVGYLGLRFAPAGL